ncbi:uncharacterized protein LOC105156269 [Sesamum indicum]|uniref:Uncharacterized protein LOC105156269 n=1 Tax=Sesamum indicum TaxID=4182 RepID=A0A6I9SLF3_SESIN|nr:uncharacterized protein LOC105156269 [Sesamum indicum]
MASSSFSLCRLRTPCFSACRLKVQLPPQARSQSFRDDQGNSSDTVDGNLSILRYRMEQVRMKERLHTCYKLGNYGWNYRSGYDDVRKKNGMVLLSIELAVIVVSTVGLVFLSGSLCIFIVALFFHHSQI